MNLGGAMSKWNRVKKLEDKKFLQIVGVSRKTFEEIIEVLQQAKKKQKQKGGAPNSLNIRNSALLTLEYLRE
jgi:hypothetical protein